MTDSKKEIEIFTTHTKEEPQNAVLDEPRESPTTGAESIHGEGP